MAEENGALSAAYDASTRSLRTTLVVATPGTFTPATPDENGAWAGAFDATANAMRVVVA